MNLFKLAERQILREGREPSQVFEYYLDDKGEPIKLCYRINYDIDIDLILVISNIKELVTIYINDKDDLHYTLKKELYINGVY